MSNLKFFVWQNEQQQGPFDGETIQNMLAEEKITFDTLLCPEDGSLDWTPARELLLQDSPPENLQTLNTANEAAVVTIPSDEPVKISDDGSRLKIRLSSGIELTIKAVRLYDEIELANVNSKKAAAMKSFQGVSTGLGAIGSIEWVLAASVVIGAAEAAFSAGASSVGVRLLEEAMQADQKLRDEGVFLPICKIRQIENPAPGLWRVGYTWKGQVEASTIFGTKKEDKTVQSAFIHNGDEFISAQTDDGSVCSIRWSAVESYAFEKANGIA